MDERKLDLVEDVPTVSKHLSYGPSLLSRLSIPMLQRMQARAIEEMQREVDEEIFRDLRVAIAAAPPEEKAKLIEEMNELFPGRVLELESFLPP